MARAWLLSSSALLLCMLAPAVVAQAPGPASSDSGNRTCPLNFKLEDTKSICASGGASGSYFSCCQLAMARALSMYTNSTGRLYLDPDDAATCTSQYVNNTLPELEYGQQWCPDLKAGFLSVGSTVCQVKYASDLSRLIDTAALMAACPNRQMVMDECSACGQQIVGLSRDSVCIVASQVFLASRNTSLLYWRLLTACIQYRFAVPIPPGLLAESGAGATGQGSKGGSVVAIAVAIPTVLFVIIAAAIVVLMWMRRRRRSIVRRGLLTIDDMKRLRIMGQKGIREVKLAELRAATSNFSEQNRIGKGGSSEVYRGILSDGSVIAVKKLMRDGRQGVHQFVNEMQIYGSLHHPNLAELYGYCQEDNELILVQEYMANGSLEDVLFGDDSNIDLTWDMCVHIILGVAHGLAYLHDQVASNGHDRVIHRDIKPGNVLLDAGFNVRLADFGVARSMDTARTHVTTKVMGTFGYLAPEYASSGKLTEKSDVYSFGVLLLVTVSKRQPASDEIASLQPGLVAQSFSLARESRMLQLVSLSYRGQFTTEQAERFVLVGLLCVQPDSAARPTMSQVILMLEGHMDVPDVPIPSHQATSSIPGMRRLPAHDGGGSTMHTSSLGTDSRQFSVTSQGTTDWNSGEILRDAEPTEQQQQLSSGGRYL